MINKSSIRLKNKEKFKQCVQLRKQGLSYSEICKKIPIAKSTLQNWLTFAGLTLSSEHLEIQLRKRIENRRSGTEASKITRAKRTDAQIQSFIQDCKVFLNDPFFVSGIMIYEAEGSKSGECRFSNSDYRLIQMFIIFLEKYFSLNRNNNMRFRLYIHTSREKDLYKIKGFWSKQLSISSDSIAVTWKRNIITRRRINPEYVGQISINVYGFPLLGRKILALSGIILRNYCRVV